MAHPNETVVRKAYEAFSRGDMATMRTLLHRDVVWHAGGKSKLAGDHRGVDAVLAIFGKVAQLSSGTYKIAELHDVVASDKHVVSLHTSEAKKGRKTYRFHEVLVFHVKRRKIIEAWEHPGDQYAIDEYFA